MRLLADRLEDRSANPMIDVQTLLNGDYKKRQDDVMRTDINAIFGLIIGAIGSMVTLGQPGGEQLRNLPMKHSTPKARVSFLGHVSEIDGIAVPAHVLAGQRPRYFQVNSPSMVVITLPGGKEASLPVKTAFINTEFDIKTESGVVVDIDLLPLMHPVSYKKAVAELRCCLEAMSITPDERMKQEMANWPEDSLGFKSGFYPPTYRAGMWISEGIGLSAKVRPADDSRWFLVLTFAADADARQALWDLNSRAATKQATDGAKDKE